MTAEVEGSIRHIIFVADAGAAMDTLQAVTEFEGFTVTRVQNPAQLETALKSRAPNEARVVVDSSDPEGVGSSFLGRLNRFPNWLDVPIVYLIDPGQAAPPEPGIALKKPVTAPTLVRTLQSLDESSSYSGIRQAPTGVERFGDYELLAKIASGGMGTVYLAQRRNQIGFHRLHAVKVMHPHLVEDPEVTASFLDEAAVASRVHHGNVAAIVDLGEENDRPYIVMQYVEGCSFSTLLRARRGPSPPTLVGAIMIDVLDGLHAAHTLIDDDGAPMSIVHRDVSPENILVGVDGIARIADFGIAKARNRISSTEQGIRKGKLLYLSPEQLRDKGLDPRVDVYAAGVVLWNALTGRRLFAAESPAGVLHNIATAEVPPPSDVDSSIPTSLDEVCLRALARDRDERYSSAAEMAQALRSAMVRLGLSVTPQDVGGWVRSVCGDELEARRALARQRRRTAGLPTTSVPVLSKVALTEPVDLAEGGHTQIAMSKTPAPGEGSWTPYQAPETTPVPPTAIAAAPAKRFGGILPFAFVGGLSIAVGALFSARCAMPEAADTPAAKSSPLPGQAAAAGLSPTPAKNAASVVAPAPPAELVEDGSKPTAKPPVAPDAPPAQAVEEPVPAAEATTPKPATTRRRRPRRKPQPKPPVATPVEKPEPKPEPKPKPKPETREKDPLKAGPDRNPYKAP